MKKENEYTLKEAAKMLNVSTQTIKRKIDKGEVVARKEQTDIGTERWLIHIPKVEIETLNASPMAIESSKQVVPVPKKQIGIYEIQKVVQNVLKAQTEEIHAHIQGLEDKIDMQSKLLEGHYRLVDERLRLSIQEKTDRLQRPIWKKLLFMK